MALHQPDPDFLHSGRARSSFSLAFKIAWISVAVLWAVLLVDALFDLHLSRLGLRPGSVPGLIGVLTAPLLHGGPGHLFNNSIPMLVALTATLYLYPNAALRVIPLIWFGSGLLGWVIGRPTLHIGASGLLYGLLVFVFLSGVFRRDMRSVSVSLLVWFLYSTLIWGIFPGRPNMSWELHLSGALMGVLAAWLYRKWDRVPVKSYAWEHDDSVPEWYPEAADDDEFELDNSKERKTPPR